MDGLSSYSLDQSVNNILSHITSGLSYDEDGLANILNDIELRLESSNLEILKLEDEIQDADKTPKEHDVTCVSDCTAMQLFLKSVLQDCELNSGKEVDILENLVVFCQRNNLLMPSLRLDEERVDQSNLSLNTCLDKEEELLQDLWREIFLKFKNALIKFLKSDDRQSHTSSPKDNEKNSSCNKIKRQRYFELLCTLYPFVDAWTIYCGLRKEQLSSSNLAQDFDYGTENRLNNSETTCLLDDVKRSYIFIRQDIDLFEALDKNTMSVVDFRDLINIYSNSSRLTLKRILSTYGTCQDISNGYIKSSVMPDISKFSATDVHMFTKLIQIYDDWSLLMQQLIDVFIVPEKKELSNIVSSDQTTCGYNDLLNWQTELESFISILRQLIPSFVKCTLDVIVKKEANLDNVDTSDNRFYISLNFIQKNTKNPLQISSCCATLVSVFSDIMVFLKFEKSRILNLLSETGTSAIVDALNEYTRVSKNEIKFHTDYAALDIDKLYQNLCDNIFLENQLHEWEALCKSDIKTIGSFHFIINSIKELKEEYISHVKRYHLFVIKSSIVYDTHSNNWEEDSYFFEGERCSFTIQMWNFYMRGIIHDLFTQLPLDIAKDIIKDICTEMLVFFTSRYMYLKVSYKKMKQVKADILILLSIYKYLMILLVEEESDYLDFENHSFHIWHTSCSKLLQTLIVFASPISLVVDHLKQKKEIDYECCKFDTWFNYIGRKMFIVENPLSLLFEIVMSQPYNNVYVLRKLLTVEKGRFSLLLLNSINDLLEPIYLESKTGNLKERGKFLASKKIRCDPIDKLKLVYSIYLILQHTSKASFNNFMENLLGSDTSKSFKVSYFEDLPLWLKLISKDVGETLKRILNPSIDLLLHEENLYTFSKFSFATMKRLPCRCPNLFELDEKKFENDSSLLVHCLLITLDMLLANIQCIPQILLDFFIHVKSNQNIKLSWTDQNNIGTKILASLLFNSLTTLTEKNEQMNEVSTTKLKKYAELLWHVIYNLSFDIGDNPNISMEINDFIRKNSKEIVRKLALIDSYCNKRTSDILEKETSYSSLDTDIFFSTRDGYNILEYVTGVLKLNEKVFRKLLGTGETSVVGKVGFNVKVSNNMFDPMVEFECIGIEHLNQFNFIEAELDWSAMLELVPIHWTRGMVLNRFEFLQESSSILNDEEHQCVSEIKCMIQKDKSLIETDS